MVDSNEALARLRDSENQKGDGHTDRLAALIVADVLDRNVRELVDPARAANAIGDGIRAITASDAAQAVIVGEIDRISKTLAAHKAPIGPSVPNALKTGLRELAQLRVEPSKEVLLKLLDREPLRVLLRAQVIDTLVAFGRKAASPVSDSAIARGLGGIGKSMFGNLASKPSALGSIANAVSGEVERQVEKRATDFSETAVAGILEGISTQLSDPSRAAEQAAMRLALVDAFLELSGTDLEALTKSNVAERVAVVRMMLTAWVAEATFASDIETIAKALIAKDADRTLREWLADVALADVVETHARAIVKERIDAIVATDAFANWLTTLLA